MIKIENLYKNFGKNEIIKGVSADIKKGEIFAIVGHSGAGKSTLLRCINGLEDYQSGSVKVAGKEVANLKGDEIREFRKNIGMIFQHFALMSRKSVFENVATPLRFWKFDENYIKERVSELLVLVGLKDKANAYPSELSGGQKQRVAIARALALKPQILLSDEATSALDPNTTTQILNLLREINKTLGITIVLVTHEMDVVKSIADRAILLKDGNVVASGDIISLFLRPSQNMREFLGSSEVLPQNGINLKLYFSPEVAFDTVITSMARTLNIDFNIVWATIEQLNNNVVGSLVINTQAKHIDDITKFLHSHGVGYEILKSQISPSNDDLNDFFNDEDSVEILPPDMDLGDYANFINAQFDENRKDEIFDENTKIYANTDAILKDEFHGMDFGDTPLDEIALKTEISKNGEIGEYIYSIQNKIDIISANEINSEIPRPEQISDDLELHEYATFLDYAQTQQNGDKI